MESDADWTRALRAVASPARLAILRQLRKPCPLRDITVRSGRVPLARQTIKEHLLRLEGAGLVLARDGPREEDGGRVGRRRLVHYVVHPQRLFALTEALRDVARLRPVEEVPGMTIGGPAAARARWPRGAALVLVNGLGEGRTFPLAPAAGTGAWLVGRKRTAHVPLDYDPYVSGEHARIAWSAGEGYRVEDLPRSRNGTSVNFKAVPKGGSVPLRHGDLVGAGRSLLLFRDAPA